MFLLVMELIQTSVRSGADVIYSPDVGQMAPITGQWTHHMVTWASLYDWANNTTAAEQFANSMCAEGGDILLSKQWKTEQCVWGQGLIYFLWFLHFAFQYLILKPHICCRYLRHPSTYVLNRNSVLQFAACPLWNKMNKIHSDSILKKKLLNPKTCKKHTEHWLVAIRALSRAPPAVSLPISPTASQASRLSETIKHPFNLLLTEPSVLASAPDTSCTSPL